MGYERYMQNTDPHGDYDVHDQFSEARRQRGRSGYEDYNDYASGRDDWRGGGGYARGGEYQGGSARSQGDYGDSYGQGGYRSQQGRDAYGQRGDYGRGDYGQRSQPGYGQGSDRSYGEQIYRQQGFGEQDYRQASDWSQGRRRGSWQPSGQGESYRGSYASDGRPFAQSGEGQGYDPQDRGFMSRAGDEVRSWFGDEEATRRREMDQRYEDRSQGQWRSQGQRNSPNDDHYHSWRNDQLRSFDRDYDEYRQENQSKFHNEFNSWRGERQTQRDSLNLVQEHMEVVGSDGNHVGTVDHVRGDRILLTKSDKDAGGHHHSIPSRWIKTVDTRVTISKSADEAKKGLARRRRQSGHVRRS